MDAKREETAMAKQRPGQGEEPALERRMEQYGHRLTAQHRQLDEFFGMVLKGVERGSLVAARVAFTRFYDALDAHITLEDRVFFPALRGLNARVASELVRLVEDHSGFRSTLHDLSDLLAKGSIEQFSVDFDSLAVLFAQHEEREERLVAEVAVPNAKQAGS